MTSILYSPQDHNVQIVYEFEAYEPNYSFDTLLVVRDGRDGKLYAATDSGCSCPVPFEDHKFPTDFIEVRAWDDVKDLLDREFPRDGYRRRNSHDSLRRAVQGALA